MNLEISYNEIINKFLFALESDNKLNNNKIDNSKSLINMLDLNQKLITIMTLRSEYCANKFREDDLYLRTKYINNLKKFNSAIKNSNLNSVFRIEKITKSHSIETNQYLSLKNIVITFSLLVLFLEFYYFLILKFQKIKMSKEEKFLICPSCKVCEINLSNKKYYCEHCKLFYKIKEGFPVLIDFD